MKKSLITTFSFGLLLCLVLIGIQFIPKARAQSNLNSEFLGNNVYTYVGAKETCDEKLGDFYDREYPEKVRLTPIVNADGEIVNWALVVIYPNLDIEEKTSRKIQAK